MAKTKHPLIKKLEAFKRSFQKEAQAALKATFSSFFKDHPEVGSIVWTQYTPYFNDGDTCEFSVYTPVFLSPAEEEVEQDEEEGGACDVLAQISRETDGYTDYSAEPTTTPRWPGDTYGDRVYPKVPAARKTTAADKTLIKDAKEIESLLDGLGDELESIFGNHVKVHATAKGFDVTEYEHD